MKSIKAALALIFHQLWRNLFTALSYDYGLYFFGAGLVTWVFVKTGLDWAWRNMAFQNQALAFMWLPVVFMGYIVPVISPLPVFAAAWFRKSKKLYVTSAALLQVFLVTQFFHVLFKLLTGRPAPGVVSGVFFEPGNFRIEGAEDFSAVFHWFAFKVYDGWPSGHTACAFSAAVVIAEMFPCRRLLIAGMFAYALLMVFSVSVNVHWASDSVAGALLGYAAGKAVGKSFNKLVHAQAGPLCITKQV